MSVNVKKLLFRIVLCFFLFFVQIFYGAFLLEFFFDCYPSLAQMDDLLLNSPYEDVYKSYSIFCFLAGFVVSSAIYFSAELFLLSARDIKSRTKELSEEV